MKFLIVEPFPLPILIPLGPKYSPQDPVFKYPKKLYASVAVPAAPVQVTSQRPLAPSVASVTSVANDKGDNEITPGAVYRSPGIYLTAEENPRKSPLGDRLMKGLCDQTLPQMGSLSTK